MIKRGIPYCGLCTDYPCDALLKKGKAAVLDHGWLLWRRTQRTTNSMRKVSAQTEQKPSLVLFDFHLPQLSVSETANLFDISVRTLYYYDEIGLLKQSETKSPSNTRRSTDLLVLGFVSKLTV